jgi:hypothetical protein
MPEPIFMKVMVSEPISTAYFLNRPRQSVCLYVYPPIFARQQLGENVTETMNTHGRVEEPLNASFSVQPVSYERKVGD